MAIKSTSKTDRIHSAGKPVNANRLGIAVLKAGFFVWHYIEMMLAMGVGSTLFELLVRKMPASTSYALGLQTGAYLYTSGIALSMMVVMVTWMIVRGHGWRHSVEMSIAMLVPVAFVAGVSPLKGGAAYFNNFYCSAMCVGMLVAMLFRWDHFTRWSFRSAHHKH